ncbi:MAG: EscU/YscU/HrcU family type III secretion system export apparatus switch protein [Acidobacteriota bacterium]
MSDKSQKTEQPTQRRVEKARTEGNFSSSKEFVSAVQFLAFVWILSKWGGTWLAQTKRTTHMLIERAFRQEVRPAELAKLCQEALWSCLIPLLTLGGVLLAVSLAAQLSMTRLGFSLNKLMPDLKRLSPMSRVPEMLRQNSFALVKAVFMLPLFSMVVYYIIQDNLAIYLAMPLASVEGGLQRLTESLMGLLWKAAGVFMILGAIDFVRSRRRYTQDLRMSKQDLRDEGKEQEGNPQIKAQIRRLQRDMARRQMMQEVKTASAVIVNPTHYAVAIRYQMESMAAPLVVAKGKNYMARRIREIAIEHQVPLVENPLLAQALYKNVAVGQEIPVHLYRAVAEILAYIYRLMHGRTPG